jgi:hypothetical protein
LGELFFFEGKRQKLCLLILIDKRRSKHGLSRPIKED